jgi:DNA invertase Pin-like site-specific DNA recombinase
VSSEEQLDGNSLDAQRRAIEAACAERGWILVAWYADEGVSAHTDDITKRPAFHQMVQDAQQRRFDAIVVHKLDCFARSVVVALATFKRLSDLGISFLSLSEQGMDFTTPMGKVLFGMLALLAEYYSENLGQETKKGKAERKAKGLHNGLVPFGYRTGSDGIAEPDPATKDGALLVFEMAAGGASYTKIAQTLNARGHRTAGNMRRGVFTKDTVRDMLANRFYLSELPVFDLSRSRRIRDWQPGQHPALVDEATFVAARQAIGARAASSGAQRQGASIYSLSGLLRCTHCGERMRVMRTEKGRVRYHCRSKAQRLGCTGSGSFLDTYDQQLIADIAAFVFPADWKDLILAEAQQADDGADDIGQLRRQLQGRLARLKELYKWGDVPRDPYLSERAGLEQELARLAPTQQTDDRLDALATYLDSLPAAWADATQAQRNQLANILYEDVWVSGPVVEYVRPRAEVEPLFQVRAGAAQPTEGPKNGTAPQSEGLSHLMAGATPMGGRGTISERLYLTTSVSPAGVCHGRANGHARRLAALPKTHVPLELWPIIAQRYTDGTPLRPLAREYGVSHECIRRIAHASVG